jgi:hypothetical protein
VKIFDIPRWTGWEILTDFCKEERESVKRFPGQKHNDTPVEPKQHQSQDPSDTKISPPKGNRPKKKKRKNSQ